jgi:hypothetical protein
MLGIQSLAGSVTLPPGEDYYEIAVCDYQDGNLIKRDSVMFGFPPKYTWDRVLKPQLLWGNVGGKMRVSVGLDGISGGPGQEDPFWSHFDSGSRSIVNSTETSPDGWVVLGYGCSGAPRGPNAIQGVVPDFRHQLESSRYVGALVVRTFKTEDEMRRAMKDRSKAALEAAKPAGA